MASQVAEAHYQRQARLSGLASVTAAAAWVTGYVFGLARTVATLQYTAASAADPYMDSFNTAAAGKIVPLAFTGVAGNGLNLLDVFDLAESAASLQNMAATAVQDAGRAAESAAMVARPAVTGYVRFLSPPSCSRCIILAGREYRWNQGFQRHPRCDCMHVPTFINFADNIPALNPQTHFKSLSAAEQDRVFTKAGAQAIRDGADMSRVVNARSGMATAQVNGQRVKYTTAGTRKSRPSSNKRALAGPRLMPESIYQIAGDDRAEAVRLLRVYGYIT